MSRITVPAIESATGTTADVYARIKAAVGSIPNLFVALGALDPDALKAMLDAEEVLNNGTLSKQEIETIKLLVSELTGCDYCVAAHTMLGKKSGLSANTMWHIRAAQPTGDVRRDALVRFVQELQQTTGTLNVEEIAAIRKAGYTDAQLVEIALAIALTVFTNIFNRINDTDLDFPPVDSGELPNM
jgi:uncharacterized peroxidase-related enzyme